MRALVSVLAVVLGGAALAVSPAARAAQPSGDPIVVGAVLSITGIYAPLGEPERNALQLAERDINAHGGVAGRPLHIVIEDDEGKFDTAQQLATTFTGQHVAAIIGGSLTGTTQSMARVTDGASTLQLYMTPTKQLWDTRNGVMKYLFEVTPRNELEAKALLGYARTKLHAKRIAILADEGPYGTQGTAVVDAEAKAQHLDVGASETFPLAATDLTAQLQRIKGATVDTVMIWTASPAAAVAVRQMRQLGMHVNIVGSTGIVSDNFLRTAGQDGDGVYADVNLDFTHPNAVEAAFLRAYRDAYHVRPSNFASFAWDAAHLAALALGRTHGASGGDALAAALTSMRPYTGTTGTYTFTAADHNGLSESDIHIAVDRNAVWSTLPAHWAGALREAVGPPGRASKRR
jgi:branched-chain amino acid transport system substrate-binding protein